MCIPAFPQLLALSGNAPRSVRYLQCAGAAAAPIAKVSGVELDSLISQVKDLLPDLGEGFILACLEEYSYNTEQVINNILEDKLVPYLDKLDRTMQRCGTTSGTASMPSVFSFVGYHLTSFLLKVRQLVEL